MATANLDLRTNAPPLTQPPAASPRYSSGALFAAANEIHIDHNGAVYTLRITRSGGLILNK